MALKDIPDSWLFRLLRWLPKLVFVVSTALILSFFVEYWIAELLVSYAPQILIITSGVFLVIFSLYARFIIRDGLRRCWVIIGGGDLLWLVLCFISALGALYLSLSRVQPVDLSASGAGFHVATYNRWIKQDDITKAGNYFATQNIEVLILQEATGDDAQTLASATGLNHRVSSNCECSADTSDVHILSRYPLSAPENLFEYSLGTIVRSEAEHPDFGAIAVYGVYLPVPYTSSGYEKRAEALNILAERLASESLASVIGGDFNMTVFSPHYGELTDRLADSHQPLFERPWPRCSWFGFSDSLCLRIDHLLVSKSFGVSSLKIGPDIGSDHRPLEAVLRLN